MKTSTKSNDIIIDKEKLIADRTKYLYLSGQCSTTEEANKQAIKELCTPEEIAAIGRLFDITF